MMSRRNWTQQGSSYYKMSLLLEEVHPAPMQSSVGVPIKTEHFACLLDGVHTEFILNVLDDHLFFVITQLGKFGTIVSVNSKSTNYFIFYNIPSCIIKILKYTTEAYIRIRNINDFLLYF